MLKGQARLSIFGQCTRFLSQWRKTLFREERRQHGHHPSDIDEHARIVGSIPAHASERDPHNLIERIVLPE